MDVFPAFGKDAYELEEAVRNTGDQIDFDDISVVEFLSQADFGGLLSVGSGFGTSDAAGEDDGIVDERIAFSC